MLSARVPLALVIVGTAALGQTYVISTVAGGVPPPTPSSPLDVSFGSPTGVAVDTAGNVFFTSLHCVFRLGPNGVLSRVAGNSRAGYSGDGGQATEGQLNQPRAVAVDAGGNLYIADVNNHRIRKVSPDGSISTVAGTGSSGYSGDGGQAVAARLSFPSGVAVDGSGNLYIADSRNHRIRRVSTNGIITTVAGTGTVGSSGDGGPATAAQLNIPNSVAVDGAANLYVVDTSYRVRKVSVNGTIVTIAGNGSGSYSGDGGPATAAGIFPYDVAADAAGNLYITDSGNLRVRKVSTNGTISTVAGGGAVSGLGDGGPATSARLDYPYGVEVDGTGNVYIGTGNRIRKVSTDGTIATVAGNGLGSYSGDGGAAAHAQLNKPSGVAVDTAGNVYVADYDNLRIRKVSTNGTIDTVAGNGTAGASGDGGPARSARIGPPWGVAADAAGNLYIADFGNRRVRRVAPDGMISTVAGNGNYGDLGDGGPATRAAFGGPSGVAVDATGNLYIADYYDNRVRKISTDGIIHTVAGNGTAGYSGDGGPGTAAQLQQPIGVAVDAAGNLYIADTANCRIRKVSVNGIISTVAGTGINGYSGDGGPAAAAWLSSFAFGVAVDAAGNLYLADAGNHRIRKVSTSGIITTIAGDGVAAYSGDGGPAMSAHLNSPGGVATDAAGNIHIADLGNNAVRVLRSLAALAITTPSPLPQGAVTVAYSQTLNAVGGAPPYTWSLTSGALPGGLKLSSAGVLSGTPTAAGTFSFTLQAKDSTGSTAAATFSLTISTKVSCTYSIDSASLSMPADGGAASIHVSSGAGCPWTASSSLGWVTITNGASGTGNGTLSIQVAANTGTSSRSGTITVGGEVLTITQAGSVPGGGTTGPSADQVNLPHWDGAWTNIQYVNRTSQSFVPTLPLLTAVEVDLLTANAYPGWSGDTIILTIMDGSRVLASASQYEAAGFQGLLRFNLPSGGVSVIPGQTYVIQLQEKNYILFGWKLGTDAYPYGTAIFDGSARPYGDHFFRTYGDTSPSEPGSAPLSISTNSPLPQGTMGTPYSQALNAAGGTSPYTWSVTSGALPDGLTIANGLVSGTPMAPGTFTFTVQVKDAVSSTASKGFSLAISAPSSGIPAVSVGGILNAASNAVGQPIAAGSLVSIYGANLAPTTVSASSVPLPTSLAGVSVTFNNIAAPLHFVSPRQINAQVPWDVLKGAGESGNAQVVVISNGVASTPIAAAVGPFSPGIFALNYGVGGAIAINSDGSLAAPAETIPGTAARPAKAGDPSGLIILATGLGALDSALPDGDNSADKLRRTMSKPEVLIGGMPAQVPFSGASPEFVGVNQINIMIPDGAPTGDKVPLQIRLGGIVTTDRVTIAVAAPASGCANIAGQWVVSEKGTLTCTLTVGGESVTETDPINSGGLVTVSQQGCEASYTSASITAAFGSGQSLRQGHVDGATVKFSGIMGQLASGFTYEKNLFEASGTIQNNVITLTGAGTLIASGLWEGMNTKFSCTAASTATLTKFQ